MKRIKVELGDLNLSYRKICQLTDFRNHLFLDFETRGAAVFAYTSREITEPERFELIDRIKALEEKPTAAEIERNGFKAHPFYGLNASEIEAWIETNVTDFQSAKTAIKLMGKILSKLTN